MRRFRWTTKASDQLIAAVERIREENSAAGQAVAQTVIDRIERLLSFPGLGRPGKLKGTRELVSPPYIIVYRFTDEIIEILNVWHGAQNWR